MNNFRQKFKWFKLIAIMLLMSIVVNTVYAAVSCDCAMDAPKTEQVAMSDMMDCHNDESDPTQPAENDCCPACIMLYPVTTGINSIPVVIDNQTIDFVVGDIVTQKITPLYRPPIIHIL